MFKDELCGVGFVLAVTDVHLELISLRVRKKQVYSQWISMQYELFKEKKGCLPK